MQQHSLPYLSRRTGAQGMGSRAFLEVDIGDAQAWQSGEDAFQRAGRWCSAHGEQVRGLLISLGS